MYLLLHKGEALGEQGIFIRAGLSYIRSRSRDMPRFVWRDSGIGERKRDK